MMQKMLIDKRFLPVYNKYILLCYEREIWWQNGLRQGKTLFTIAHIYLDAFDKKGPIGDLYSKAVAEYLERFTKTENCFM